MDDTITITITIKLKSLIIVGKGKMECKPTLNEKKMKMDHKSEHLTWWISFIGFIYLSKGCDKKEYICAENQFQFC